jgi:hypothetical protein
MPSYLIQRALPGGGGSYLERRPYDGAFVFLAAAPKHATVFSYAAAVAMQARLEAPTTLVEDYYARAPEITEAA